MFALWMPWRGPAWASSTRRCCARSTAKRRGPMTQHHEDALSEKRRREVGTEAAEHILGPNPVVGVRGQDLFQTASMLVKQAVKQPHLVLAHGLTFAAEAARIVGGSSRLAPDAKDCRFQDPTWHENEVYWNNDTTRLPAALHSEFLTIYQHNPLAHARALTVRGTPIDVSQITCDVYVLAGST